MISTVIVVVLLILNELFAFRMLVSNFPAPIDEEIEIPASANANEIHPFNKLPKKAPRRPTQKESSILIKANLNPQPLGGPKSEADSMKEKRLESF